MEAGNFKSSVNSNVALHYFVSLRFDWSRKPASYYKIQTIATIKPITTWLPAFSRASHQLHAFDLYSHWFLVMLTSVLIGFRDEFGFSFMTLPRITL